MPRSRAKVQPPEGWACAQCATTTTTLLRNHPLHGPRSLCNACGIRWARHEGKRERAAGAGVGGADVCGAVAERTRTRVAPAREHWEDTPLKWGRTAKRSCRNRRRRAEIPPWVLDLISTGPFDDIGPVDDIVEYAERPSDPLDAVLLSPDRASGDGLRISGALIEVPGGDLAAFASAGASIAGGSDCPATVVEGLADRDAFRPFGGRNQRDSGSGGAIVRKRSRGSSCGGEVAAAEGELPMSKVARWGGAAEAW